MKNSTMFYAAIGIGVIALIVGAIFLAGVMGPHPARGIAGLVVGALLVIGGVVGTFMARPKEIAK